jgi:uncharacterized protein with ParB-like and HNH nuclease domain
MQTDLYTVSKLFTERLMRIPDYQRGYAWTEKQLKDYWSDLEQLEVGKSHYIGVLTLEDVPKDIVHTWADDQWIINAKGYAPFYIVDGQQRLTTTIILLQAITECIEKNQKLNYTGIDEIKRKFLWDSRDDGISRSYIFGYEKDNPSYEFLKTNIFLEESDNNFPPQETIYTHNLAHAKSYFLERLKKLDFSGLEEVYRKVTQQFLFNIYAISREVDVFVAFETMNNRGKPLSHLELLKNRLIYLSTKFNVEDFEKNKLRSAINESWKSIYHYLGKNKENPLDDDLFLRNHFLLYFGSVLLKEDEQEPRMLRRGYVRGYKDYLLETQFTTKNIRVANNGDEGKGIATRDIYEYAKSLKSSVELWYQILNPYDSNFGDDEKVWLDKLNRLTIEPVAPLIMVFFQKVKSRTPRIELLKAIEQFLFFNELVRYRSYFDVDQYMFLEISSKLSSDKIGPEKAIKEVQTRLEEAKNNKDILQHVQNNFRNAGYYNWRAIKYFLYEYDQFLKSKTKTYREKIDWKIYIEDPRDYHTVENIYPQRPRKPCWTELYKQYHCCPTITQINSIGYRYRSLKSCRQNS